jgi:hypothetical protein
VTVLPTDAITHLIDCYDSSPCSNADVEQSRIQLQALVDANTKLQEQVKELEEANAFHVKVRENWGV